MLENNGVRTRDRWEKADVLGKWIIPVAVALATVLFESGQRISEAKQKTLEVAINILQAPKTDDNENLRAWALGVLSNATGTASAALSAPAEKELRDGAPLPSPHQSEPPDPEQVRVSIIRLEAASENAERLRSSLASAGYKNVMMVQGSEKVFPKVSEVRYYHNEDQGQAEVLSDHIQSVLRIGMKVTPKTDALNALRHRPGDFHIYLRE